MLTGGCGHACARCLLINKNRVLPRHVCLLVGGYTWCCRVGVQEISLHWDFHRWPIRVTVHFNTCVQVSASAGLPTQKHSNINQCQAVHTCSEIYRLVVCPWSKCWAVHEREHTIICKCLCINHTFICLFIYVACEKVWSHLQMYSLRTC